jgi:DNA-binding NarL/FixJ family response regulator
MTIHVLLADVQALLRQTFRILLDSCEDIEVVGEAADGREAVDQTRRLGPDIVVIDIRMPDAAKKCVVMHLAEASESGSTLVISVVDSGTAGAVEVADSRDNDYTVFAVENGESHRVLIFAAVKTTHALGTADTITSTSRMTATAR